MFKNNKELDPCNVYPWTSGTHIWLFLGDYNQPILHRHVINTWYEKTKEACALSLIFLFNFFSDNLKQKGTTFIIITCSVMYNRLKKLFWFRIPPLSFSPQQQKLCSFSRTFSSQRKELSLPPPGEWGGKGSDNKWVLLPGPGRGGDTLVTPLKEVPFSMFSVATAQTIAKPIKSMSLTLVSFSSCRI